MASVFSKIFAITGGASGIGAATCRLLAERGAATLCVGDISSDKFDQLKSDIAAINPSTTVKFTKLNVTSPDEVERWIEDIVAEFGDFHGAANVAGIAQAEGIRKSPAILEENDEEWRRIFNVNVDGVFFCTRAQVRAMHRLPTSNRSIVNVTSIASMAHTPDVYAYGASKGCAAYFTTCVAPDAFPWGIRVNSVSPGITETPLLQKFLPNAEHMEEVKEIYAKSGFTVIKPEDVARTIVWLLSDDSKPVYGANINVGVPVP